LEERHNKLEERVDTLDADFDAFKKQIINYLETGQNKPDLSKIDPVKAAEIIKKTQVKTVWAQIRKGLLLTGLALVIAGIFKSSNANFSEQFENNNPIASKPPIVDIVPPISSKTPIVDVKPPINSPEIEGVIVTQAPEVLPEEKVSVHILDEDSGLRDYYDSAYAQEKIGVTDQKGVIIRYFIFQNNNLVAEIGREEDLQNFIANNDVSGYTWKIAVSCLDAGMLQSYIDQGVAISLEYTTFYTDYIPTKNVTRTERIKK
ncbi:MAG: hypothetical protein K2J20_03270, partial [Bacilli bacterium]|nr:hypothetical protein [Bacilli bacterium]